MVHQHIVKSFDDELNELQNLVAEMGGLVEAQIAQAMKALIKDDVNLAQQVVKDDLKIDEFENRIDAFALRLLALRQPMAEDLRIIVAAYKVAANLERIGDYAKNIAKRTVALARAGSDGEALKTLARMGELVQVMIKNVLDAYANVDDEKAQDVIASDEEVDRLNTILFKELLSDMMDDPDRVNTCTHLLFVAKNIERIGDHTTSIAERVLFVARGETLEEERPKEDLSSLTVVAISHEDDEKN